MGSTKQYPQPYRYFIAFAFPGGNGNTQVDLAKPIRTSAGEVSVSGSLGFAIFPLDAFDIDDLKRYADEAMYAAKKQHNCWRLYQGLKEGA